MWEAYNNMCSDFYTLFSVLIFRRCSQGGRSPENTPVATVHQPNVDHLHPSLSPISTSTWSSPWTHRILSFLPESIQWQTLMLEQSWGNWKKIVALGYRRISAFCQGPILRADNISALMRPRFGGPPCTYCSEGDYPFLFAWDFSQF